MLQIAIKKFPTRVHEIAYGFGGPS
jgi:hypothetical protein